MQGYFGDTVYKISTPVQKRLVLRGPKADRPITSSCGAKEDSAAAAEVARRPRDRGPVWGYRSVNTAHRSSPHCELRTCCPTQSFDRIFHPVVEDLRMRSGRTAWISLRRCARSVAKAHWIVALGVQIGATGAAFALTKEAAVENC